MKVEVDVLDQENIAVEDKFNVYFEEVSFEGVDVKFKWIEFEKIDVEDRGVDVDKDDFGVTGDIEEDEEVA
jgi:hypothetical protein